MQQKNITKIGKIYLKFAFKIAYPTEFYRSKDIDVDF